MLYDFTILDAFGLGCMTLLVVLIVMLSIPSKK